MARRAIGTGAATATGCLAVMILAAACGGKENAPGTGPGPSAATEAPAPGKAAGPAVPPPGGAKAGPAKPAEPDRVVATVNGSAVHLQKVDEVAQANRLQIRARGAVLSEADEKRLRAMALRALIADELMYQASKTAGIAPTSSEIDEEIQQAKSQLGTEQNYRKFLEQNALTEQDVRAEAERRIQVRKYQKAVTKDVNVKETEAKAFYDGNPERFRMPEMVRASIIVVKSTPNDPDGKRADAKRRIDEARRRAEGGEDFAALAKQYSEVGSASQGGDLGLFPKGVMFPKLEELAFATSPGKITPVFETPTGYNVLKVVEKKESQIQPFEDVKARLTLDMARFMEGRVMEAKLTELYQAGKVEILDPALDLEKVEAAEAQAAKTSTAKASNAKTPAPKEPAPEASR